MPPFPTYYVSLVKCNDDHLSLGRVINFGMFPIITKEIYEIIKKVLDNWIPKTTYAYTFGKM